MITISSFQEQDKSDLVALWQKAGLLTNPANDPVADIDLALSGSNAAIFVGRDAGGIVRSSVMVGHDGHRGWIYYLAVDTDHQKAGLGRQIMRQAEQWLTDQGLPKAMLMVRQSNLQVVEFYQRLGYQLEERAILSLRLDDKGFHGSRKKVTVPRHYLDMREKPSGALRPMPEGFTLLAANNMDTDYFLYLLKLVGGPWHWTEKLWKVRSELDADMRDPSVSHHVLYHDGQPAGFAELKKQGQGDTEIVLFGLVDGLTGKGLGGAMMDRILEAAWQGETQRVMLTTCGLDHPGALSFYQKQGFSVYKQDEFTHYI